MKSLLLLITALSLLSLVSTLPAQTATQVWATRYNGPANRDDYGIAMSSDSAGNVAVTGLSTNAYGFPDYCTAKYAAVDGGLLWERRYKGSGDGNDIAYNLAYSVAMDADGNVVVTGSSTNTSGNADNYTVKYAASDGALLWERRYNGPANSYDRAHSIGVDSSGNVVVTGFSYSSGTSSSDTGDYYTAKYAASDGALVWERRYNGSGEGNDLAYSVAVDAAGNVVVTGISPNTSGNTDYYTAKYSASDGALLWERRYNGPGNGTDVAHRVAFDAAGNAVVTGGSAGNGTSVDFYTAKYAGSDGTPLWERRYNGPGNSYDVADSMAVDAGGNVFVTGRSQGAMFSNDYYTAMYAAADGALLWERRYGNSGYQPANSVAVDAAGNAVITGRTYNGSNYDYYTAKYAATGGALLWEARYNGTPHTSPPPDIGAPYGGKIALTPDGGAIVTGNSHNGSNWDYATVRYAPPAGDADGDGLQDWWEQMWWGATAGHSALDDFDHDGIPELLEMAFGLNPKQPDALPPAVNEGGYLTITITKHPGVTYEVQTAATPDAPAFSFTTTTVLVNNATTAKVRDNIPIGTPPGRYLRVKVTAAP